jgi:pSer/pThr/pTyr-binding forkhead associated (FHA) protein
MAIGARVTYDPGDQIAVVEAVASIATPTSTGARNAITAPTMLINPPITSSRLLPACFSEPHVPVGALERIGVPLTETVYLTVGGGLGSFVWVDHLRIFGARPEQIVALGVAPTPYTRLERLCRHSQIPSHERLRSNSDACPDNLWGWPGFAVRECWASLQRRDLRNAAKVLWQVFAEPTFAETYTPHAGAVYTAIDREAARIGWKQIWQCGRAQAIRKTADGRYVVACSRPDQPGGPIDLLIVAQHIHIAVGYPGMRILPDIRAYRARTGDRRHVVNAYEAHDHIYTDLLQHGGVVLLRGRGIVASRIIQRLDEVRRHNSAISILHLLQTPIESGHRYGGVQRRTAHHWEFQVFNWPKACWGGELRVHLEQADDQERNQLLTIWGGTTTASRAEWVTIIDRGIREGWYQIRFGEMHHVEPQADGILLVSMRERGAIPKLTAFCADFIIDCTGLETSIDRQPLLRDLLTHYQLGRNPRGGLQVDNSFAVVGMDNGPGRMYASGAMTFGGPFAPVDSFLGLQYAALCSAEALVALRAPALRPLTPLRSLRQWIAWARGVQP